MPPQQSVGQMLAGDHGCLSFDTEAEQYEVLTSYIRTGLQEHEQVLYFAAGDPASVMDFLRDRALEPDTFVAGGQLRVLPPDRGLLATKPFDPDIMVERLRQATGRALAAGYRGLRLTGEGSVLRGQLGSDRLAEYEDKAADVFAEGRVVGLCQYDRRVFSPAEITAAESAHSRTVVPDPLYRVGRLSITRMFRPPGFRMVGELDSAEVVSWLQWISRAAAKMEADLHLDLAGLSFIDVAGARMLALLSDNLARRSRRLVLHELQPTQCLVFHLAGWDRLPNLVLPEKVQT